MGYKLSDLQDTVRAYTWVNENQMQEIANLQNRFAEGLNLHADDWVFVGINEHGEVIFKRREPDDAGS
jgi:hypothetical protein